ncbi:hypothetical protein [Hymenobacter radiodurans]|uniref:hypothetical protein n=1 Tax=Hymenobacter radiodurans TaxID=2496028 RepID=UPI001F0F86A1|nr:hypothetical protein [Hymenobacter radiodurans]
MPSNREAAEDEARYLIMVESDEKAPQHRVDLPQLMAAFAQAIHQAETTWKS